MTLKKWTFTVEPSDVGLRLDQLIAARTELSRRQAREALRLGGVQAARTRIKMAGKLLRTGTEVRVAFDPELPPPPEIEIPIVFEDAWLLAVNKPAGLPTQGTWASDQHDLQAMLKKQLPGQKLFLHHRLDQGTSGLLLFAKDPAANPKLTEAFTHHKLEKLYLARIAEPLEACEVSAPIGRLRGADPGRFGSSGDLIDPRSALTRFRPASEAERAPLVAGHWVVASPATGRTHQIRVHLAGLGRPILGDGLYGGKASDQLWLHAWKLRLEHPVTGEALELSASPTRFLKGEA